MRSLLASLAIVSLAAALSAGCARQGGEGESCEAPGLTPSAIGQCASGFVCTPNRSLVTGNGQSAHWDVDICRPLCSSNVDCTTGTSCRGVSGAEYLMACQPD